MARHLAGAHVATPGVVRRDGQPQLGSAGRTSPGWPRRDRLRRPAGRAAQPAPAPRAAAAGAGHRAGPGTLDADPGVASRAGQRRTGARSAPRAHSRGPDRPPAARRSARAAAPPSPAGGRSRRTRPRAAAAPAPAPAPPARLRPTPATRRHRRRAPPPAAAMSAAPPHQPADAADPARPHLGVRVRALSDPDRKGTQHRCPSASRPEPARSDRVAIVACLALAAPAPARARRPTAPRSATRTSARGTPTRRFERNSRHYLSDASCDAGGDGLAVSHDAATQPGRSLGGLGGARAGAGPRSRGSASVRRAEPRGGNVPELLGGSGGQLDAVRGARGRAAAVQMVRRADQGASPPGCAVARRSGCGRGRRGRVRVKRLALLLDDHVGPTLAARRVAVRRRKQTRRPDHRPVGRRRRRRGSAPARPGERRSRSRRTRSPAGVTDRIATRLRPCPGEASASFTAATASSPFRQGPNTVRVCAADYAATHRGEPHLHATAGSESTTSARSPRSRAAPRWAPGLRRDGDAGRSSPVAFSTGGGQGVPGARVCVATRIRIDGVAERVVAAPLTDAEGRFRAAIPSGPSREVRVAYWPSAATALRALPRSRRPRSAPRCAFAPATRSRTGAGSASASGCPVPASGRRRVRIQAHAGRRWLDLRGGLTGAHGVYRARYRFHATTGRRTYALSSRGAETARLPLRGRQSKVKRVTVIG